MAKAPTKTTNKTVAAEKPDFAQRAAQGLPFLAAFLCLAMLGMAAVTLFDVNTEPKSPPSGTVTSIAAQGFTGLRRLLEADGASVALNRFEDGNKDVDRGDLEIITLEDDNGVFAGEFDGGTGSSASTSASASSGVSTSADQASAAGQASADDSAEASSSSSENTSLTPAQRKLLRSLGRFGGGYQIPDDRRVDHLLHHPLGRAVLVVAPKWTVTAATGPQGRWGEGPSLTDPNAIANILAVLAPVKRHTIVKPKVAPKAAPKNAKSGDDDDEADDSGTVVTVDHPPYTIVRAAGTFAVNLRPLTGSPVAMALNAGKIDQLQSITGPNLVPVLSDDAGRPVLSKVIIAGGGATAAPVYLLSDPDLLDNSVLSDPQRTATALDLIHALTPPAKTPAYVFNLTFNSLGFDHDLVHALSRPPYIGVPLSLLITGLGLIWAAFSRFGPPKAEASGPALGRGVRVLADNAARLMAVTVKETKLGPAYAQLMRDQVLKIRGYRQIDARESADALADRISQIYKSTQAYSDLKAQASRVLTVHQLIDVVRDLHTWKNQIAKTET